jgi:hypothetical protein
VRTENRRKAADRSKPIISARSNTSMARAFMTAEMIMAAANYGGPIAARVRAENVLDDYFALVEQAVPCTEHNPLDRRSCS